MTEATSVVVSVASAAAVAVATPALGCRCIRGARARGGRWERAAATAAHPSADVSRWVQNQVA